MPHKNHSAKSVRPSHGGLSSCTHRLNWKSRHAAHTPHRRRSPRARALSPHRHVCAAVRSERGHHARNDVALRHLQVVGARGVRSVPHCTPARLPQHRRPHPRPRIRARSPIRPEASAERRPERHGLRHHPPPPGSGPGQHIWRQRDRQLLPPHGERLPPRDRLMRGGSPIHPPSIAPNPRLPSRT